jgi:hypothetical protein
MIWKPYILAPEYEVSDTGLVRKGEKVLKQYPQKNGYVYVWLDRGYGRYTEAVHKIVAWTFLEHDERVHDRIDHINTIRSDNRVENLRWTDAKGNANNPITKVNMSKAHRKTSQICKSCKGFQELKRCIVDGGCKEYNDYKLSHFNP